jgi:hypothetical protein
MDELVDRGVVVPGGALAYDFRVALVMACATEEEVRATLARDLWSGSHLLVDSIERWTIRLDGRRSAR